MMDDMLRHIKNGGYIFYARGWRFTQHNGVAYSVQGVLISSMRYKYLKMYPHGSLECSECLSFTEIDHEHHCYVSAVHGGLVCAECADVETDRRVHAYLDGLGPTDVHNYEKFEFFDKRLDEDELVIREEELMKMMEGMNENMSCEFVYLNNKTIEHIRAEFLAKRVIRRWRNIVAARIKERVVRVLYHCVGMDFNASLVLAKSVKC